MTTISLSPSAVRAYSMYYFNSIIIPGKLDAGTSITLQVKEYRSAKRQVNNEQLPPLIPTATERGANTVAGAATERAVWVGVLPVYSDSKLPGTPYQRVQRRIEAGEPSQALRGLAKTKASKSFSINKIANSELYNIPKPDQLLRVVVRMKMVEKPIFYACIDPDSRTGLCSTTQIHGRDVYFLPESRDDNLEDNRTRRNHVSMKIKAFVKMHTPQPSAPVTSPRSSFQSTLGRTQKILQSIDHDMISAPPFTCKELHRLFRGKGPVGSKSAKEAMEEAQSVWALKKLVHLETTDSVRALGTATRSAERPVPWAVARSVLVHWCYQNKGSTYEELICEPILLVRRLEDLITAGQVLSDYVEPVKSANIASDSLHAFLKTYLRTLDALLAHAKLERQAIQGCLSSIHTSDDLVMVAKPYMEPCNHVLAQRWSKQMHAMAARLLTDDGDEVVVKLDDQVMLLRQALQEYEELYELRDHVPDEDKDQDENLESEDSEELASEGDEDMESEKGDDVESERDEDMKSEKDEDMTSESGEEKGIANGELNKFGRQGVGDVQEDSKAWSKKRKRQHKQNLHDLHEGSDVSMEGVEAEL